ncbi:hypothetical protein ACIBG8_01770 [Nonomuraea sp. NPDC050556]|uniref:hypothetical protein n=1 Tax=Nonomuraea sp. NPDC050556 TaxID=3364369 RepID=UPI0037AE5C59
MYSRRDAPSADYKFGIGRGVDWDDHGSTQYSGVRSFRNNGNPEYEDDVIVSYYWIPGGGTEFGDTCVSQGGVKNISTPGDKGVTVTKIDWVHNGC